MSQGSGKSIDRSTASRSGEWEKIAGREEDRKQTFRMSDTT